MKRTVCTISEPFYFYTTKFSILIHLPLLSFPWLQHISSYRCTRNLVNSADMNSAVSAFGITILQCTLFHICSGRLVLSETNQISKFSLLNNKFTEITKFTYSSQRSQQIRHMTLIIFISIYHVGLL